MLEKRRCPVCGKDFMQNTGKQIYCGDKECLRIANNEYSRKSDRRKKRGLTRKKNATVNNTCPKDCRFRELLAGKIYNCNYGQVAHEEGKIDKPVRGGTVDECTVYEPGTRKRRTVQLPSKEGRNWF